jgi:hypothetical protein
VVGFDLAGSPRFRLARAWRTFSLRSLGTSFGQISVAPITAALIEPLRRSSIDRGVLPEVWIRPLCTPRISWAIVSPAMEAACSKSWPAPVAMQVLTEAMRA